MKKQIVFDEKDLKDLETLIIAYEVETRYEEGTKEIRKIIDNFRTVIWDY